jgi:multicomponent K+:H+ antiporter subunit D
LPADAGFGREWLLVIALLGSGLAGLIALSRVGMRLFWSVAGRQTPRLWISEAAPVAFLILICVALTVAAEPAMTYLDSAAAALEQPDAYIRNVLGTPGGSR